MKIKTIHYLFKIFTYVSALYLINSYISTRRNEKLNMKK